MNLSKSLELLYKIKNSQDYDKEFDYVLVETSKKQIGAEEILKILNKSDIDYIDKKIAKLQNSNLYQRKTTEHGKRHIENVMLFAMIIAKSEGVDEKNKDLLLEAAMYHDQGRDNDLDEQHGIESAYIAGNELKNEYDSEEVKIIQAVIMFHDDRTKGNSLKEIEDNGFQAIVERLKLCKENYEKTRLIGNILKDADALDRARFIENFCPIDQSYLRTEMSKKLIKFAMELHEAYSIDDLEKMLKDENEEIKKEINDYMNATSPIRAKMHYETMINKSSS